MLRRFNESQVGGIQDIALIPIFKAGWGILNNT
jgi:hypothetical protein